MKVNLYLIKASAGKEEYRESVTVFRDMEEKPASYIGHRKRVNKAWINEVHEGMFYGSYQMYVTDPKRIPAAREELKNAVEEFNLGLYQEYRRKIGHISDHDLISYIPWKDHNGDLITEDY